jgi:Primase C terminal 1 (PriCT-1)
VNPHLALDLLIAWNFHRGMPPLGQVEVERLVSSAAQYVIGMRHAA